MNDVGTWEVITLSCICVILLVCQRISVVSSPVSQLCCVCVFGHRKEIELAHSETDLQAGRSSWWRWHEAVKPEPSFYISINACDSLFLNQSPNTNAWNYANKQTLGDIYCNVNDTVLWSSTCATDSHKPFLLTLGKWNGFIYVHMYVSETHWLHQPRPVPHCGFTVFTSLHKSASLQKYWQIYQPSIRERFHSA